MFPVRPLGATVTYRIAGLRWNGATDNFALSELNATGSVFIGRPWHPSSNPDVNPSAVFIDCDMDDHIAATGWTSMGMHEPLAARFFEYKSHGVGSVKDPIRRILTDAEARPYAIRDVLAGWEP